MEICFPVEDNPSEKKMIRSVVDSNTASFSTNDAEIAQTISSNTNSLEVADVRNYSYEYIHNEVSGLVMQIMTVQASLTE